MINSMTLTTYTHPFFSMAIGVALTLATPVFAQNNKATADAKCPAVLQHTVERLQDEKPQNLCQYAGQVVVVVNTASFCGFTPQYKGLEELHARYKDKGLVVLGFPSNDFSQEPVTTKRLRIFARTPTA